MSSIEEFGNWEKEMERNDEFNLSSGDPFYATSQDVKLRKAAEGAIEAIIALEGTEIPYPVAMKLSAALKSLRSAMEAG